MQSLRDLGVKISEQQAEKILKRCVSVHELCSMGCFNGFGLIHVLFSVDLLP